MRAQMFSSFIQLHFSADKPPSNVNLQQFLHSSIYHLPRKDEVLDKALAAMSCLYLGRINNDTRVFFHGIQLYNDAIGILAKLIHRNTYTDAILYAAFIFQELAGFYSPSGLKSWSTHVSGMNAVLTHFHKRAPRNPVVDAIYNHQHKINIILLSRGLDLSQVEYELVMEPTGGNPLLEILQITVSIGKIQSAVNSLDLTDHMACQELLQQCYGAKESLMDLQNNGSFGEPPFEGTSTRFLESQKMSIPATEPLFGSAYSFSSQDNAMLYMMFWFNLIILQPLIHRARFIAETHINDNSPTDSIDDHDYLLSELYTNEIARSIPYCLQESMKSSCIQVVLFVTSAISKIFLELEDRDKFDWCQHVFQHMADNGSESARHIVALAKHQWEHRVSGQKRVISLSLRRQIS
ncbi:hypothetical protein N7456_012011 [Penicillium angulare]|uniref:Uncharacterized protein n=1 Tax=Penicillium angulare TaxID=116970 RepID=A0A9W9K0M4_9EURO|nr:hypothetical protein N7456_012011 [Penicillium angulare]